MKLVRDKIPQIISENGMVPEYEFVKDERLYKELLDKKLIEEVEEYLQSGDVEEICDILEVIYAILRVKNLDMEYVENKRIEKKQNNGAFEKRILLKRVDNC